MNTQDYLSQVLETIRECFRPTDSGGSMPVATAAYLAKQKLRVDHTTFGFAKFKDVLKELEGRGLVRTGTNTKNAFAIWLPEGSAPADRPPKPVASVSRQFRPLRNQVWFAFVSESPAGRRFLNRVSGDVQVGLQEAPGSDWVEIVPIDPSSEKEEAARFLVFHQLERSDEVHQALDSDKWYVDFPVELTKLNPQLAADWKRGRSTRIMDLIEKWRFRKRCGRSALVRATRPARGVKVRCGGRPV